MATPRTLPGRIFDALATIGGLALIAIALMVTTDVTVRWLTGQPVVGVFEFASLLLVPVAFLPLGLVIFSERQLRVDILPGYLRGKPYAVLGLLDAAIGLVVFGALLWAATEEFQKAYFGKFLLRGMIEIPTFIPIAIILCGTLATIVALALKGWDFVLMLTGRKEVPPKMHETGAAES